MNKAKNNSVNSLSSVRKKAEEVSHGGHGEHREEMCEALPKGWVEVNLEECTNILDGYRDPVSSDERNKRIAGKKENELFSYYGATGQVGQIDDYLIEGCYVLIGEDGAPFFDSNKNIAYMVDGKIWVNNHAHILDSFTDNYFLCHFLNQFDFTGYVTGTTRLKLTQGKLRDIPVKFPPLNEQKRIVAKLDAIMPRIEAVKARMDKVPGILKRFRQSVLTAAVTGKLTEQWREAHPEVESADSSLSEVSEKLSGNYLNVFEDTQYCLLPDTWIYAPLEKMGKITGGGTPSKSKQEYWKGNIPWISPKDMKKPKIKHGIDYISDSAVKNSSVKLIPAGSILFVVRGMILAHTFPVALTLDKVTINQDMKGITPIANVQPEFLLLVFQNIQNRVLEYIKEATHGTLRLEMEIIQSFAFPLPPLEEQKEIVRQVDKLFALADKVEVHYQKAKARVEKLSQSVLAKAFRGELVPQDPNDEPAEKLLERILEEKERLSQGTQKTRRKK